jgi:putative membrane protein
LLPSRPRGLHPAPRRARWKSPLRWHWLGYDRDDAVLVVTGGRVDRTTVWVPLEKVQSLRLVQGPVQRRLGLATLHADVAGRRVRASVRDRDAAEAEQLMADLARACRAARRPLADSAR